MLEVWKRMWRRRLGWRAKDLDREIDEELAFHLEQEEADLRDAGFPPDEARFRARRALGNDLQIREVTRAMWMWRWADEMLRDARLAMRALWRSPVFAITAVASLALGIGANVASFSAADAFLLRPLPVREPDSLMAVFTRTPDRKFDALSYPEWEELHQVSGPFQGAAGYSLRQFAYAPNASSVPQMRMGLMVTPAFFDVLGVTPALGRSFTADETRRGGGVSAVILGHDFWMQQYGGDRGIVGQTLRVNGVEAYIAGVVPESFTGMDPFIRPAFFVPVSLAAPALLDDRGTRGLQVRARLAPGVSPTRAEAALQAHGAALERAYPASNRSRTFIARSDLSQRIEQTPQLAVMVVVLLVLSALVLAISCANVAGLLLGRSRARFRELAIRVAVGAGRGRLMRQFFTESLVLAGSGGVAGVAMAYALSLFLASIRVPTDTPIVIATRIDWRALVFTLGVSVVSALAFGLLPGLRLSRMTLVDSLRASSSGGSGSTGRNWSRRVLVSAQVALSLVLLVVSASMIDAFQRMSIADPGMRTRGLFLFEFNPAMVGYGESRSIDFYRQLKERVGGLPGVHSAALSRAVPFRPNFTERDIVPEAYEMPAGRTAEWISTNLVDEHYLATAGVLLIQGRGFAGTDTALSPLVAVVNEEFARRYWSSPAYAVGRRLRLGVAGDWVQVVGVARNAKYLSMAETPQPYVYLPFAQHPSTRMTLMVAGEGTAIAESVLRSVRDIDPNMPVFNARSMDTFFEQGVLGPALLAVQMVVAAGVTGLALALIGIYGLVSYSAERRTREIGIRMAIGASRWSVLRMMLSEGLALAGAGTIAGLVISVPAFRAMSAKLAGLGGLSPWALWAAPLLLIAVTACACYFPSRRAAAIDPIAALRID